MNEKLSDYIDKNLIKTVNSQSRVSDTILTLELSKMRLIKICDKDIVYHSPAAIYYKDETLIDLYRSKLISYQYIRNRSLCFSSNNIIKILKRYKASMNESFKYYRRTK